MTTPTARIEGGCVRSIGDPRQRIAEDRLARARSSASTRAPPGSRCSTGRASTPAGVTPTVNGLSGERVRKELFRTLDAPGGADAFDAMPKRACSITGCPNGRQHEAARVGGARSEGRCAAPAGGDPAGGGRCDDDRQAAETLDEKSVRLDHARSGERDRHDQSAREPLSSRHEALHHRALPDAPGDWRAASALAGRWTPPELPIAATMRWRWA